MYCYYKFKMATPDEDHVTVFTFCRNDMRMNKVVMTNARFAEYERAVEDPSHARPILEILPDEEGYTDEMREFLMSGYCHDCQKIIFPEPMHEAVNKEAEEPGHDLMSDSANTALDLAISMCKGNPGALLVLSDLAKDNVDWQLDLLKLDAMGLYGKDIYILWNDCCGRSLGKFRKVIEAWDSGKISKKYIFEHLSGVYGTTIPDDDIDDGEESNR